MPTSEVKKKHSPGRQKVYASAAERQEAYRARLKEAGKPTDPRKDLIASLRDEIAQLRADHETLQLRVRQREEAIANREAALVTRTANDRKQRDLEYQVAALEHEIQQWKFRKADRLRELLNKRFIKHDRDLAAVFLVDYAGKPIERGFEFERATKAALEFGRKAATASGGIAEIAGKLARNHQINADEQAILDAAQRILSNLHDKATRIKESAKSDSERVKREEAARTKAAVAAVASAFPDLEADAMLLTYAISGRRNYHIELLAKMRPESASKWDLEYHLAQLVDEAREGLRYRVENAMKEGKAAAEAAMSMKATFDAARPRLEAEISSIIQNVRTCQVAARLTEAARAK